MPLRGIGEHGFWLPDSEPKKDYRAEFWKGTTPKGKIERMGDLPSNTAIVFRFRQILVNLLHNGKNKPPL